MDWIIKAKEYHAIGYKLLWKKEYFNTVSLWAKKGSCDFPVKRFWRSKDIPLRFNWIEKL